MTDRVSDFNPAAGRCPWCGFPPIGPVVNPADDGSVSYLFDVRDLVDHLGIRDLGLDTEEVWVSLNEPDAECDPDMPVITVGPPRTVRHD
jgi:hypothetical protein